MDPVVSDDSPGGDGLPHPGGIERNLGHDLGDDERAGLETFYRYAAEIGIVDKALTPTFYDER